MRLLIDTHVLIWHSNNSPQVSATAAALLNDPSNDLYLSMASAWEIAIKVGLKKLTLNVPYVPFINRATAVYGMQFLPISLDDCSAYEQLAFPLPNHRDPFDRMIVIHARNHGLSLVSADSAFDAYGVTRLW